MRTILLAWMMVVLVVPGRAGADGHYLPLSKIFPSGKCSGVIPNFELMTALFVGGEITEYKIRDNQGRVVEVITSVRWVWSIQRMFVIIAVGGCVHSNSPMCHAILAPVHWHRMVNKFHDGNDEAPPQ